MLIGDGVPGAQPRLVADRYELQALIGRGGAGSVHRAWDRTLERIVAVKILPSDPDDGALQRRRSEAHLLASLSHASLVTLFDAVAAPEATYLVMEFLGGGTLQARIHRGRMTAGEVAAVAEDVAGALAHIHERGIVHRDVKPANILLAEAQVDGRPPAAKLSDFGIAKLLETSPGRTSGVLGTAQYLSPEQARGTEVGPASDVYSLGITLIEAATGRLVFPGSAVESLTARLLRDPEVPGGLGYGWRSLLTAMTSREPDARPTAKEVARRAAALAGGAEEEDDDGWAPPTVTAPMLLTDSSTTLARPASPGTRGRRRLVLAGGALAVAAAAAVGLSVAAAAPPWQPGADPAAAERSASGSPSPYADPTSRATRETTAPSPSPSPVPAAPAGARTSAAPAAAPTGGDSSAGKVAVPTKKAKKAKAKQTGRAASGASSSSNGTAAGHGRGNSG